MRRGEVLRVVDPFGLRRGGRHGPRRGRDSAPCVAAAVVVDGSRFAPSTDGGWIGWEGRADPPDTWARSGPSVVGADGSAIPVTSSFNPPDSLGGWIWAWSPATDQLAFATGPSGLAGSCCSIQKRANERPRRSKGSLRVVVANGTAIAIAVPSSGVSIIDLATWRSTSIARIGAIEDHDLSWSPDGTRLVLASTAASSSSA